MGELEHIRTIIPRALAPLEEATGGIIVGGASFETQKAALAHVRALLVRLGEGTIVDCNHVEFGFLRALFERHPDWIQKRGAGLSHFRVARDGALTVRIGRVDGTEIDASFIKAITRRRSTPAAKLRAAMRAAIIAQTERCRELALPADVCELCGDVLGDGVWHVDHAVLFETLVREFLQGRTGIPARFGESGPMCAAVFLTQDVGFERAWSAFHEQRARLRVVHAGCNLRRNPFPTP